MEKRTAVLFLIICHLHLTTNGADVIGDDFGIDKREFKAFVTPSEYYGIVDGKSTKIPIEWEVKAFCKDCLIHNYKAETDGAGKFDIKLAQPFEGFDTLKDVEFTIESKGPLIGHKRVGIEKSAFPYVKSIWGD